MATFSISKIQMATGHHNKLGKTNKVFSERNLEKEESHILAVLHMTQEVNITQEVSVADVAMMVETLLSRKGYRDYFYI